MAPVLFAALGQYVLGILLFLTSLFLILLVLVQRGRGGGLTGALGGAGGQSAFGTKAGDVFTRVTVVVACFWILLCMLSIITLNNAGGFSASDVSTRSSTRPTDTGAGAGGTGAMNSEATESTGSGAGSNDTTSGAETSSPASSAPAESADEAP